MASRAAGIIITTRTGIKTRIAIKTGIGSSPYSGRNRNDLLGTEKKHALDYMYDPAGVLGSGNGDFLYHGRLDSHLAGYRIDRSGIPGSAGT